MARSFSACAIFFLGLAVISLFLAPYLPLVLWLSYRVCGLGLGWLAGLACVVAYPLAFYASMDAAGVGNADGRGTRFEKII